MAECKDCIHYCICEDTLADKNWNDDAPQIIKDMYSPRGCANFKNKADFVEVVRCKDCKYLKYGYQCYCPLGMNLSNNKDAYVLVNANKDFCSYGERSESNAE